MGKIICKTHTDERIVFKNSKESIFNKKFNNTNKNYAKEPKITKEDIQMAQKQVAKIMHR